MYSDTEGYSAEAVTPLVEALGGTLEPLLPGYRIKILDGNCLEATEHRIHELRGTAAGPLPGKSLVVLDPSLKLMVDVFPCEDGYTQERALLEQVLPTVQAGDCWIEDRNFCTLNFLFGVVERAACFIVRQHGNLPWEPLEKFTKVGRLDGATVSEQPILIRDHACLCVPHADRKETSFGCVVSLFISINPHATVIGTCLFSPLCPRRSMPRRSPCFTETVGR